MEESLHIMDFLCAGKFESAWDMIKKNDISIDDLDYQEAFQDLERDLHLARTKGDIRTANRLKRRLQSLTVFRTVGFIPEKMMSPVDLHEGYHGKILMVRIVGGGANGLVGLRSGDDWHREILRNTQEEIQDLGFDNSQVMPMGGAWVRFDPGDTIRVYGSSDEFGGCDKNIAADLLNSVFPNKKILIRHSQGCRVKVFAGNIRLPNDQPGR
ncbi:MAG: hypothetical protein DRI24_04195 [Deltaproteobacteria bacterium]|nr:MAG: hypothetical protein DRI24_04195 [Deltaproteobacteria bacterium]